MLQKKGFQICMVSLVSLLFILFGSQNSMSAEKQLLTWGTTSRTSGLFPYFVLTAKILNEKIPDVRITVRSTTSGTHNGKLLEKKEVDIGAVDTITVWDAIHGQGNFEGAPFSDFRLLYVNMTNKFQIVVSEKSGVKDIYGLNGKAFTPGMPERLVMRMFNLLGIRPKIRQSGYADAVEQMKNEMIVGFAKFGVPDASIMDVASTMKIRLISFSDQEVEKIVGNISGLRKTVVPLVISRSGSIHDRRKRMVGSGPERFPARICLQNRKNHMGKQGRDQKMHSHIRGRSPSGERTGCKSRLYASWSD